ncbi:hypothetical protein Btru_021354 [Bulinus truncatus]|nr:hypothetical protein Btru_021354 [Bulinus truncatus]
MATNGDIEPMNNGEVIEGLKRRPENGGLSPPFSPSRSKLPRHRPSELDEELSKAGESLQYSMFSDDAVQVKFELPRYPIQEKESREYFERQLSQRHVKGGPRREPVYLGGWDMSEFVLATGTVRKYCRCVSVYFVHWIASCAHRAPQTIITKTTMSSLIACPSPDYIVISNYLAITKLHCHL